MSGNKRASQSQANQTRREQLHAQQQAAAKRQQTKMRLIYAVSAVVFVAIVATVGVVIWQDRQAKQEAARRQLANQIKPPNLNADGSGIIANPLVTGDVPTLSIYLDFQCPACKSSDEIFGETVNQLAAAGKVKLEYKVLTFLDRGLRNDSSERAARGAFCADVSGVMPKYHDVIFDNQPKEGAGFSDQQLREDFPKAAGLQGAALASFQTCYDDKQTANAVKDAETEAQKTWKGSTPQYNINGKNPQVESQGKQVDWWQTLEPTTASWEEAINKFK